MSVTETQRDLSHEYGHFAIHHSILNNRKYLRILFCSGCHRSHVSFKKFKKYAHHFNRVF